MLRTAILRSTAITARTAVRPIPSAAARRIAVAPAPRVSSFVPKMVAWKAVRCYASGGSLERDEVYERVLQVLSNKIDDPSNITEDTFFVDDLNLDSMDLVEMVMDIEEEFSIEIPDEDAERLFRINDAVNYVLDHAR
ncbi:hypothetical protein C7999DRAFT_30756 [Corynascus novoguineensis]|uniref:Acyl carrier protein n=1 Tax=Corynascus novoguineensis TaxID=1126955 RepID=A0AAN7HGE0_9PEZI|nr:hypothetical protein C7999DRAFT_30756 [Corynascus novoguineensis]